MGFCLNTLILGFVNICSSSILTGETIPGAQVPNNGDYGSDADWQTWVEENFNPVSHPIGTAAMMRRDLGGMI